MSSDFTKTAIKALKRQTKDQLVSQIMNMAAYAEKQKAANIILMNAIEKLKTDRAAELESKATVQDNAQPT